MMSRGFNQIMQSLRIVNWQELRSCPRTVQQDQGFHSKLFDVDNKNNKGIVFESNRLENWIKIKTTLFIFSRVLIKKRNCNEYYSHFQYVNIKLYFHHHHHNHNHSRLIYSNNCILLYVLKLRDLNLSRFKRKSRAKEKKQQ